MFSLLVYEVSVAGHFLEIAGGLVDQRIETRLLCNTVIHVHISSSQDCESISVRSPPVLWTQNSHINLFIQPIKEAFVPT
jgi:hypothetical protein